MLVGAWWGGTSNVFLNVCLADFLLEEGKRVNVGALAVCMFDHGYDGVAVGRQLCIWVPAHMLAQRVADGSGKRLSDSWTCVRALGRLGRGGCAVTLQMSHFATVETAAFHPLLQYVGVVGGCITGFRPRGCLRHWSLQFDTSRPFLGMRPGGAGRL